MTKRQGCAVILLDGKPCPAHVTHRRWRVAWRHELGRELLCDVHYRATEAQAGPRPGDVNPKLVADATGDSAIP